MQTLRDLLKANGAAKPARSASSATAPPAPSQITPEKQPAPTVLGIGAGMDYTFPFDVKIQLDNVGGPSAGQMFALGIIDKLTPGKLNGGEHVAGTGTIDNEGNVGAIGGIRQKMYGARAAGATCSSRRSRTATRSPDTSRAGSTVFAVKTLDDSLAAMKALSSAEHGEAPRPARPRSPRPSHSASIGSLTANLSAAFSKRPAPRMGF